MQPPKTARPARELNAEPALNSEQLAGELNHSNNRMVDAPQAAPDNSGESDFDYFTRRPHARHRIRAPFPREFPPEFLTHRDGGTPVITVVIERDARGRPTRRGRGICFIDGGRA